MTLTKEDTTSTVTHNEDKDNNLEIAVAADEAENLKLDFRTVMGFLALAMSYEACLFAFILPAALLVIINQDIGPSPRITWVANSWALAGAVLQTIAGRLSDIFGRRNYFLVGNTIALIGCCVASRASNVNIVIVGTSFMGVGSGLQFLAFAAAAEIVPKKNRSHAIGFLSFFSLPGSGFGSVIAFSIASNLGWRWAFYLGIIVNGAAILLILVFYWPPGFAGLHPEGDSRMQQFRKLDFFGLLLFGGGLTTLLVGINFGGNPYPWTSATVLCPIILGGLSVFVGFPVWQYYCPAGLTRLCPPNLVTNIRGVTIPLIVVFVSGMTLTSLQVLWPQEIQMLFTTVPATVGWYGIAYNAAVSVGLMGAGYTFAAFRRTRYQLIIAVFLQVAFTGSIATVNQYTPTRAIVLVASASVFIGASQCMGYVIVQLGAKDEDIGVATGLVNSLRSTGGAIAIAIYSSLIHNKVTSSLAGNIGARVVEAGLPLSSVESFIVALTSGIPSSLSSVAGVTPAIIEAGIDAEKGIYSEAFKLVYTVSVAFGGIACIAVLFVANVDDKMTSHVNVRLDKPHVTGHGTSEAKVYRYTGDEDEKIAPV